MKKIYEAVGVVCLLCIVSGCDSKEDAGEGGGQFEIQDLTGYEETVREIFEIEINGTAASDLEWGVCAFDGEAFSLTMALGDMSCFDSTESLTNQDAAPCDAATDASWPVTGVLSFDGGTSLPVTGEVLLFFGDIELQAFLQTDPAYYAENFDEGLFENMAFDTVINQIIWDRRITVDAEWESCLLSADTE